MTKKTLLLATSAAAILFGGANAYAANISGITTVKLATELPDYATVTTSAAASQTTLNFNLLADSVGGFPNGESLRFDLGVTGAVFTGAATITGTGTASCSASVSVSTPTGQGTSSTAGIYFISLSGCTASGSGLAISVPVQATGAADGVISAGLTSSFGTATYPVEGGAQTAVFADLTDAYNIAITTTSTTAVADVSQGYQGFTGSIPTFATVSVTVDPTVSLTLGSVTTATTASISAVRVTASATTGSFTGYTIASSATPSTATANGTTASFTFTTASTTFNTTTTSFGFNVVDGTGAIPATSISLTAALDLVNPLADDSASQSAFAIVTRNGTSFVAPWVSLAGNSSASIRLANNGTAPTGPIQVTLLSNTAGVAATNPTVTITQNELQAGTLVNGGIAPGGVITIASSLLRTALGTNAGNGDLQIAIEAQPGNISGKVRVTQATGQTFEASLNNLSSAPQ